MIWKKKLWDWEARKTEKTENPENPENPENDSHRLATEGKIFFVFSGFSVLSVFVSVFPEGPVSEFLDRINFS